MDSSVKRGIIGSISLIIFSLMFLGGVFFSMPSNVLDKRDGSLVRSIFTEVLPESWGFFTKPPNEPELAAYSVTDGRVVSELRFPHSRQANLYGLMREHRAQGPELAAITADLTSGNWITCYEISADCIIYANENTESIRVSNSFPVSTLCGDIVVAETVPVPWSYRNQYEGWRVEQKTVYLDVECE